MDPLLDSGPAAANANGFSRSFSDNISTSPLSYQLLAIQTISLQPRPLTTNDPAKSATFHIPCKFHRLGQCQAGEKCSFSHGSANPVACKYHKKNVCKFASSCMLTHPTHRGPAPSEPVPIPSPRNLSKDLVYAMNVTPTLPCSSAPPLDSTELSRSPGRFAPSLLRPSFLSPLSTGVWSAPPSDPAAHFSSAYASPAPIIRPQACSPFSNASEPAAVSCSDTLDSDLSEFRFTLNDAGPSFSPLLNHLNPDSFNWVDDHHYRLPASLTELITPARAKSRSPFSPADSGKHGSGLSASGTVCGFRVPTAVYSPVPEPSASTPTCAPAQPHISSFFDAESPKSRFDSNWKHYSMSTLHPNDGGDLYQAPYSSFLAAKPRSASPSNTHSSSSLWSPTLGSSVSPAYGSSRRPSGPSPWTVLPTSPLSSGHFTLTVQSSLSR